MSVFAFGGVDPGLIHTGVVHMSIATRAHAITIHHEVVVGPDEASVASALASVYIVDVRPQVFIEKYKPRGTLNHNAEMLKAEQRSQEGRTTTADEDARALDVLVPDSSR